MRSQLSPVLTADDVRAQVRAFWTAFTEKDAERLMAFYAPESSVFGSGGSRTEPGRLAAARRQREYFHPKSSIRAVPNAIEVTMLDERCAVASYTFDFHAAKPAGALGNMVEETIDHGRATQVFRLNDEEGTALIVHEHFSLPDKA